MDVWHSMNAPHAWLALETAPVFVTVHGTDFLTLYHPVARLDLGISERFDRWLGDHLTSRLVGRALPHVRHVFTNSRYTEEVFLRHYPACRGKTSVASVGIADADFAPRWTPRAGGPVRFISICRLFDRRKNITMVLEALARLPGTPEFHYTIVGDGELRPELEELTIRLGLADRVAFAGFVDREKKIDLLRQSDLFLLPAAASSKGFEGFGLVYLEANACGTPVLAARFGGAIEAVEEGVNGYFVEELTAEGIALALRRFLSGELRFKAEECVRFARRFSWHAVAKHCVAHYTEALSFHR
jgi:glycosyltransferase involved in cell wall biosynthesis